ncbi:cell cycle checkpoint control protein RAD9A-like [Sinocyclocheilus rhinocerous]|uniref:cell cycle checkpoint control protein RAD9A-like n=1 Tax=Sinocyclocheilus rhinocerous TaxID=307959 RepID=UPI0007B998B7|nr:PREDICTED: cell cycle checkpoint control protein RAD9A-like [Sinocyclocheilus rhinocerous]
MKCVIEGNGIKVFGKAVHALSRIGDEIWLDPLEKGLAVRTVNSSQSAYACFCFTPLFFQQYIPDPDIQKDCEAVKCKLNLKCVLPLFRCASWRERSVDKCEISINIPNSRVIFQFHCRHGITKTYNLGYQECEALQAVFPAHLSPNILMAQSKLLGDIVVHFPVSQEEVTLSISSFKVTLKTFCEEENNCIKGMNTELMLHPDEFDYFQVGEDSAVTFCLKELRGLLSFAESYGLPVSSQFGVAGQPVSFTVKDMTLEAHVVLSTLTDPNHESPSQPAPGDDCPVNVPKTSTAEVSTCEGPMETEVCVADGEQVASSQGSEVFNPTLQMRKMIQLQTPGEMLPRPRLAPESALTTPVTPATFKIRSLLFGAVYTDVVDSKTADLPSLACASDTEEDGGTEE